MDFDLPNFTLFVEHTIFNCLLEGDARVEVVAERLGLSPRTLQRRLQGNGTSYRRVLDRTRLQVAARLLEKKRMTQGKIAEALGYSSGTAFNRAFKRWTGWAPGQHPNSPTELSMFDARRSRREKPASGGNWAA
jgi:AraC-like DNA-binding protein